MDDDGTKPQPAFSLSPDDRSSDRAQSDVDASRAELRQDTASDERAAARHEAHEDAGVTAALLHRLINESRGVVEANGALALAMVEYQERARLAKRRYVVMVTSLLLGLAFLAWRQQDANIASQDARHSILDCVTPSGQCYKDAQARTGQAIGSITQVTVLAAACAPDYVKLPLPARALAIQRCIERKLASAPPGPIRTPPPTVTTARTAPPPSASPSSAGETRLTPAPTTVTVSKPATTRTVTAPRTSTPPAPPALPVPLPSPLCSLLNALPLC